MRAVEVNFIVNWDESSAKSSKFRPTHGRREREVLVNEWQIGNKTYSAIAALTTVGFLPYACTKIFDVARDAAAIQQFLFGFAFGR